MLQQIEKQQPPSQLLTCIKPLKSPRRRKKTVAIARMPSEATVGKDLSRPDESMTTLQRMASHHVEAHVTN